MNSSNSFNICPHCNNSNSLNARFCARCGAKLVVPEEVVVCHKCHTRNSPLANFCRNCGTPIKAGALTKICPKCGREVNAEDNVCTCGHSFATVGYVSPDANVTAAPVGGVVPVGVATTETKPQKAAKTKKKAKYEYKPYGRKGGRAFAIIAAVFLALFVFALVSPMRLSFIPISADSGVTNVGGVNREYVYNKLVETVNDTINVIKNKPSDFIAAYGGWTNFLMLVFCAIFAVTAVVQIIVVIVRIFTGRRSKKANIYMLVMAIVATIVSLLIFLLSRGFIKAGDNFIGKFLGLFDPANLGKDRVFGTIYVYVLPAYYWFFFLYSLVAKRRRRKIVE